MENNFYIGIVYHSKKILKPAYKEKLVLYTMDGNYYIDLISNITYSTDNFDKNYVLKETLIPTDILEHRIDYAYLLSKYNQEFAIEN